jgi:hypothetical protein
MNSKLPAAAAFLFGLMSSSAQAVRPAMDPLNRLHAGGSFTSAPGIGLGFDSRMTNLLWMDMGAFMSMGEPQANQVVPNANGDDTWLLRHGLYLAPGLRMPHQQAETIQWDIFVRGGFSGIWAADAASDYDQVSNLGLFSGGELVVKSGSIGMRLSGKFFYFRPYSKYRQLEVTVVRPQYGAEAIYQF